MTCGYPIGSPCEKDIWKVTTQRVPGHRGMGTGRPGWNTGQVLLLHRTNEGVQMEPGDADVGIPAGETEATKTTKAMVNLAYHWLTHQNKF